MGSCMSLTKEEKEINNIFKNTLNDVDDLVKNWNTMSYEEIINDLNKINGDLDDLGDLQNTHLNKLEKNIELELLKIEKISDLFVKPFGIDVNNEELENLIGNICDGNV